jgi:hypothetical protein
MASRKLSPELISSSSLPVFPEKYVIYPTLPNVVDGINLMEIARNVEGRFVQGESSISISTPTSD